MNDKLNQKITFSYENPNDAAAPVFKLVIEAIASVLAPLPEVDRTILVSFNPNIPGDIDFDLNLWNDGCVGNRILAKKIAAVVWGRDIDPRIVVSKFEELAIQKSIQDYSYNSRKLDQYFEPPIFDSEIYQTNIKDLNGEELPDLKLDIDKDKKLEDNKIL